MAAEAAQIRSAKISMHGGVAGGRKPSQPIHDSDIDNFSL